MFKVHVNDGQSPLPTDDICYIVAKEGIFLKKKIGVMESIAPVKNISILESVNKAAQMHIKRIPGGQFSRVIAFFREVYAKYHAEAIVLIFYDLERKIYKIIPPTQRVTGASCDYDKGITINNMQMIGTIHSHASMSAFHSGTDDKDEEYFDGLHITIGNLGDEEVSISASIVANGYRFNVEVKDYVDKIQITQDIDQTEEKPTRRVYKFVNGKMEEDVVASSKSTYTVKRYDKRYVVKISDKYKKVIPEWMDMVERGTFTQYNHFYDMYDYNRNTYNQHFPYNNHYNPRLWRQWRTFHQPKISIKPNKGGSPLNVGPAAIIKPIAFPNHTIDLDECNDNIPCQTCKFKGYKLLAEQDDVDENDVYKCKKCESIIVDELLDVSPTCPKCKTDDFLMLLGDDNLSSHYTADTSKGALKNPSSFITCKTCNNGFHSFEDNAKCPFCYTPVESKDLSCIREDESVEIEQIRQDVYGHYIYKDAEEANIFALEECKKEDVMGERIPDPAESSIPLPEKAPTNSGNRTLLAMFKNIFGKERG